MPALEGQIAVVTGGSQGIGRGVCLRLAQDGARVAILDISDADETRRAIADRGGESWYHGDRHLPTPRAIERPLHSWRPSGVRRAPWPMSPGCPTTSPSWTPPRRVWDRHMDINAKGMFFCCQSAARRMRRAGGGRIVNILSTAAGRASPLESAYCASKGAARLPRGAGHRAGPRRHHRSTGLDRAPSRPTWAPTTWPAARSPSTSSAGPRSAASGSPRTSRRPSLAAQRARWPTGPRPSMSTAASSPRACHTSRGLERPRGRDLERGFDTPRCANH